MTRLTYLASILAVLVGCSSSHGGDDAGTDIMFDATFPDTGPDPATLCGNGELDVGEMCDDGNDADGDGCDAGCRREAYCGNGTTDSGEVCDDGNNISGDGCRSDCRSDETCGNDIIDFAAGELCDGEASCSDDCTTLTGCGDGTVEAPEQCDDGNTDRWDGCDAGCREEVTLVLDDLTLARTGTGCDLDGDGSPDNAFARALGLISSFIGPLIQSQIQDGNLTVLLGMIGLDDRAGQNDEDFRVAWLFGQDADDTVDNNFNGAGEFFVSSDAIDATTGAPAVSIQSSVTSGALLGGPEDIPIPISFFPIELKRGRVQGTMVADAGELYQITDGLLCGGIQVSVLSLLGGFAGDMLETDPPCEGTEPAQILDLIIAGGTATVNAGGMTIPVRFTATAPDLDLDADGLEGFEVTSDGPEDCQPVVTACRDGDRTRIEGRGCFSDPRIQDGYSAAFGMSAIQATVIGVEGAPAPGP